MERMGNSWGMRERGGWVEVQKNPEVRWWLVLLVSKGWAGKSFYDNNIEKLSISKLIDLSWGIQYRSTANFSKSFFGSKAGILLPKRLLEVIRLTEVELELCCLEHNCDCQNQYYLPVPSKSGLKH